jgi:thiol-disulfide isomerase/thioredoxin
MIGIFVGAALWTEMFRQTNRSPNGHAGLSKAESISVGTDFTLYGKTLDNEDFDWESLRGKYVLVKFTSTWCGPCKGEIPGMQEAYKKYHDQGLEIVSVYIWEQEPQAWERKSDAAETVKKFVEQEKLPWIIVSESLTIKAGQPPQGEVFEIAGVPTMLLVDKDGKVLATGTRGGTLTQKLKELFGE